MGQPVCSGQGGLLKSQHWRAAATAYILAQEVPGKAISRVSREKERQWMQPAVPAWANRLMGKSMPEGQP